MTQVCFGEFALDTDTRELLRSSRPVHLSPKAYELLKVLVEDRPKAVAKSDLQQRLWPGTFVVEANLANLVSEIREALGENPRRPRYLRTVHGFGYAFRGAEAQARQAGAVVFKLIWKGGRATLTEGEHVLGRDADVSVVLDSPSVSRRHARILIAGEEATLEDLGSKNGTLLNEQRVQSPRPLTDGDKLHVGSVAMTFRILQPAGTTQSTGLTDREDP